MSGENAAMKVSREQSEKTSFAEIGRLFVPLDSSGVPLVEIWVGAAELIPTRQFANVTVGPVGVRRWIAFTDIDNLKQEISNTQTLCEEAVAEARQSLHALLRQSDSGRL